MADSDRNLGASSLATDACWALLRSVEVGRLAVSVAGSVDIFPLNFLVDHGTVVFRSAEGTKLSASVGGPPVAFEADGYDREAGRAWSVVIKGHAEEIKQLHEVLDAMTFPLFPWQAGPKQRYVRIVPGEISGRSFHAVDAATWHTTMTDAKRASDE